MKTTLNKIRSHNPCQSGWKQLLEHLGKTQADDEPLLISEIVKSNGLLDALWCTRAVIGYDKEIRLFAVWCARQVQHFMRDERSIKALDVAERYAHGQATYQELEEARQEAEAAASAALGLRSALVAAAWAARHAAAEAAVAADEETATGTAADAAAIAKAAAAADEETADEATYASAYAATIATQKAEFLRICAEIEEMEAAK